MRQPMLGIVSSVLVIAVSLAFISFFSVPAFTSWVAYLMISVIPAVILFTVTWSGRHPSVAVSRPQPWRGVVFVGLAAAAGVVVAAVHFATVGGLVSPPAPMLSMCIITTVVVTFWLSIMWGGWPFNAMIARPVAAGLALLAAAYVVNYAVFRLFFDFSFMKGDPAYVSGLDPQGLFNAWSVVVFLVTMTAAMFLVLNFDLWPLTLRPALVRQPLLGVVWTAIALGIAAIAFFVATGVFGMPAPVFMVRVPIPFIFGTIIVMNMMQNSIFGRFTQPLRGLLNAAAAAAVGVLLAEAYRALAPVVSGPVEPGPPGYVAETWLASALLAVTFPLLIILAELFQFWPLARSRKAAGPET